MTLNAVIEVEATDEHTPEAVTRTYVSSRTNPFDSFADRFAKAWESRQRNEKRDREESTVVKLLLPFTGSDLAKWKNQQMLDMNRAIRAHVAENLSTYRLRDGFALVNGEQRFVKDSETDQQFPVYFMHVYISVTRKRESRTPAIPSAAVTSSAITSSATTPIVMASA